MSQVKTHCNTIEEAVEDIQQGKVIIIVDDEDRENEGDFAIAAEKCTPEIINFMAPERRRDHLRGVNVGTRQRTRARYDGRQQYVPS